MTTLTSSATFTIGDAPITTESATVVVLPVAGAGEGFGRLIHPTLGTYDYAKCPDEWLNLDGDVIVPPVWASQQTLGGAANTLWPGYLKDVVTEERWVGEGGLSMSTEQLRMLIAMWMNPVDPAAGFIEWWPNYTTTLGFKVAILSVESGGQGITLDHIARVQGWMPYAVTLRMRILGRA